MSIGIYAFAYCSGLTSVTIPNSVTSIGDRAFEDCSSLTSVTSEIKDPFSISDYVFSFSAYNRGTLYVPRGTGDKYQTTEGWKKFKNIVEMSEALMGDVNGDDVVDVADIATIISYMAGDISDLPLQQTDVNQDGTVDVADIATVISIMAAQARRLESLED